MFAYRAKWSENAECIRRFLHNTLAAAQLEKSSKSGEQISASEAVQAQWETAKKSYMWLVKVARVALKKEGGATAKVGCIRPLRVT